MKTKEVEEVERLAFERLENYLKNLGWYSLPFAKWLEKEGYYYCTLTSPHGWTKGVALNTQRTILEGFTTEELYELFTKNKTT